MKWVHPLCLFVLVLVEMFVGPACADLNLPAVINSHMVLQRDQPVLIWGWANVDEEVVVRFAGQTLRTTADDTGLWKVELASEPANAEPQSMVITSADGSEIKLTDILVGEVWFCTGPSNIYWPVKRCDNASEEIQTARFPQIRFFSVEKKMADELRTDCEGRWDVCSPDTVGETSGVGYFFARRIHQELDVPVGLLQSFWGGSRIEAWTSLDALNKEPSVRPLLDWWQKEFRQFDPVQARAEYEMRMAEWKRAKGEATSNGGKPPRQPRAPRAPQRSQHRPACLFNGMVAPLIPFGIRGVICYQGLGNLHRAEASEKLLETMIRDWRSRWGLGEFPVGMVQPAPFDCSQWARSGPDAYSIQREAQLLVQKSLRNVGIALTMDINGLDDVHFTNKQLVGQRLAHWALASVYGADAPWAGPLYDSMRVEGRTIRVRFQHAGPKLTTSDGQPPRHFEIAGEDRRFYSADAAIDGTSVVVRSSLVPDPVAVRFAFQNAAIVNLVNSDGLPASLFRSERTLPSTFSTSP